jgi:hypothetical protein
MRSLTLGSGSVLEQPGVAGQMIAPTASRGHPAHSLRCKAIALARLKRDKVDAATLAQLLRVDLLPEVSIVRFAGDFRRLAAASRLPLAGRCPGVPATVQVSPC